VRKKIEKFQEDGFGNLPICIKKRLAVDRFAARQVKPSGFRKLSRLHRAPRMTSSLGAMRIEALPLPTAVEDRP
jgi:hypothetical protein